MILATTVSLTPQEGITAQAGAALSPTLRADVRVLGAVSVSVGAMCHTCITSGRAVATQVIDLLRNWFQVVWPNTVSDTTKVVDGQATWDRGNTELVGPAMGVRLVPRAVSHAADAKSTVSVGETFGRPEPARIRELDLCPKANSWG